VKPRPHQQQCRSNVRSKQHSRLWQKTATMSNKFFVKFRPFDVLSTKSKQIDHVQFVSTWSKGRNSFDVVGKSGNKSNNVEPTFDFVERIDRSTCSTRRRCFDIVAGVDGASGERACLSQRKRGNMFSPALVCVSVCVSVCLSVITITLKHCGRICTKFYAKVARGKGKTKFVFRCDR